MIILYLGPECDVIEFHLKNAGHKVIRTERPFDTDFLNRHRIDFGISYRYRYIIEKDEIDWFQGKLVNLHISFLPFGRGADPNIWSYLEDSPKGVTIHKIDYGIDTGPILIQKKVSIDFNNDTLGTSYKKLTQEIEKLFIVNSDIILNSSIKERQQTSDTGSFHYLKDKNRYEYLWKEKGWDTPVLELIGKARTN